MDIKPSNVLFCKDTGKLYLIDFGLSAYISKSGYLPPCGTEGE